LFYVYFTLVLRSPTRNTQPKPKPIPTCTSNLNPFPNLQPRSQPQPQTLTRISNRLITTYVNLYPNKNPLFNLYHQLNVLMTKVLYIARMFAASTRFDHIWHEYRDAPTCCSPSRHLLRLWTNNTVFDSLRCTQPLKKIAQ